MNRLPDSGRGYRYGQTPEDRFPRSNQQRPEEGFSRFDQGSHFDSLLGRAPHGYGSLLSNPCIPLYFMAIMSSC